MAVDLAYSRLYLNFDASYKEGIAAIAIIVKGRNGIQLAKYARKVIARDIQVGEFLALNWIVSWLDSLEREGSIPYQATIRIKGDSRNIIKAIANGTPIKSLEEYQLAVKRVRKTYFRLKKRYNISLDWIPRKSNKEVDRLARRCLYSDY